MAEPGVNVYLIDLDDTLIADVPAASEAVAATLATVGLPAETEKLDECLRIIRKSWKAHPHRHTGPLAQVSAWEALWLPRDRTGGLPAAAVASLRQHEIQTWRAVLTATGLDPARAATAAHAYRSYRADQVRALPGVRDTLTALHRNHRLWLVTNGVPAHQRGKLSAAALSDFFEKIFVSGDVGSPKSDPRFAATIRQALHGSLVCRVVGDSVTQDVQLAVNGGWAAAHICGPEACAATGSAASVPVTHIPALDGVLCGC